MNRHQWTALRAVLLACLIAAPAAAPADEPPATGPAAGTLRLRAGSIDVRTRPSLLKPGARFESGGRYVVQLDGPITPQRRAALADRGVRLGRYLPMHAYLADLDGVAGANLVELGFVAWVGRYESDWSLCPQIGTSVFVRPDRQALAAAGRVRLSATTFDEKDAASGRAALERRGASIIAIDTERGRITFDIAAEAVQALRDVPELMFVEEALEPRPRNITTNWISQSNVAGGTPLWDAGLHGEGQIAGILDWYMKPDHCAFDDPVNPIGPLHRKIAAYYGIAGAQGFGDHGTHVAGVCVGDAGGGAGDNLTGLAFAARVVFQNMNSEWNNNMAFLLSRAHAGGARIHNISWGANGTTYNQWAADIDSFSRFNEDDLVFVATANGGSVQLPENAKNCVSVAATLDTPSQHLRCLGADGPTTDGRRKPEVLVPGCGSNSANFFSTCGVRVSGGTSFATPAATAMAVLARQYFTDGFYPTGVASPADAFVPTGALLKAVLINSAVDMTGVTGYPSNSEGWGRVLADDALFLAGDARKLSLEDVRNSVGLSTGQSRSYPFDVAGSTMPLKITLVWTDVAATVGAAFTSVNNLDLRVTSPGGTLYRGNVFSGGQSVAGGSPDAVNNTEQVHRLSPAQGTWTVEVLGAAVSQSTQGFALVVTGDLALGIDCSLVMLGDVNQNGASNGADVADFVSLVVGFDGTIDTAAECAADTGSQADPCTPDNTLDLNDVPGFVSYLLHGTCP